MKQQVYTKAFIRYIFVFLILPTILLSGCSKGQPEGFNGTESTVEVITPPTPTPPPDRVVLVSSATANITTTTDAGILLTNLAAASGLEFETRQEIFVNEITADIKVLVFLSHPENLGSMANAAPQTQFIVLTDRDWNPSPNVTTIRLKPEHQVFLAGYIATMIPANYRGGGLLASENILPNQAFRNGGYYYCGLCQAVIYPLNQYPVAKDIPANSPASSWLAAFEDLNLSTIESLYITPEAYSLELFNYLTSYEIILLGIEPPPDEARPRWAVTVLSDGISPIQDIWSDLSEGKGGKTINASLKLTDIQSIYLTEGKMALVQKVISRLQAGEIYTLDIPLE
jgi:hypothetical protein